jgi:uncharacterized surface protein with fasciclin (FAS1) repeats
MKATTVNGQEVTVHLKEGKVFNVTEVVLADVLTDNGVIHKQGYNASLIYW